jgi:hypothetical protein
MLDEILGDQPARNQADADCELAKIPSAEPAFFTNCGNAGQPKSAIKSAKNKLTRVPFTVSRLMEFATTGADLKTFNYKRLLRDDAGLPTVIEIAFGYCPDAPATRRLITGVNWSVGINNPFRQLGENGDSLDTYLEMQRVGRNEPVILLVHLASPRIAYTDRGKSALALGGAIISAKNHQEEFEE